MGRLDLPDKVRDEDRCLAEEVRPDLGRFAHCTIGISEEKIVSGRARRLLGNTSRGSRPDRAGRTS